MNAELDELEKQAEDSSGKPRAGNKSFKIIFMALSGIAILVIAYFGYSYIAGANNAAQEPKQKVPPRVIQLDVLNGCGVKGVGSRFTEYLRANGFDVVEMKNYKSFQVKNTLVVDRIGDLSLARKVAAALGVEEKNIIQQLNPDYFVDLSVIIGKDFSELKVQHQ